MGDFINVQNLSIPEEGSQFIVTNTYTVSFYNPYEMFVSSWNPASDNTIRLFWRDKDGHGHSNPGLKDQVVVKGQNTFSFRLADYNLDSNNISGVGIYLGAYVVVNGNGEALYFTSSKSTYEYGKPIFYTTCGAPTEPTLDTGLSREPVRLSWGAGRGGTNNAVTGYDVQRRESSDGNSWGSWEKVPNSPVTTTEISVSPPNTAGSYYQFRVRTRGSAGSKYYSKWVTGTAGETTLRRDHDALAGFTDDPLIVNTSSVKALHMQELQSRVNTLRTFYGLNAYSFTAITAGTTSLAGWTTHVNQIRAAIEDVCSASGKTHENWISFSVNCPRADVIQQLRSVILAL